MNPRIALAAKALRFLVQKGPSALLSRLWEEAVFVIRRTPCLAWMKPLMAKREWARCERELRAASPPDYNVRWGEERLKLYQKWGSLPCPTRERQRLATWRDAHKGERIFIMGNGPSLNQMRLDLLKSEKTFGLNRIYLMFDRLDWRPSFYTCIDWRVTPDNADEINALRDMTFFFPWQYHGLIREGEDVFWFRELYGETDPPQPVEERFSFDITHGVRHGNTVTVTAIQLAFYLGFDPIYLIGVDANYAVGDTVVQTGTDYFGTGVLQNLQGTKDDDPNHFDPRYFGTGKRYTVPHVPAMIRGFENCRDAAAKANRRIINATAGGMLEVFERADFEALF